MSALSDHQAQVVALASRQAALEDMLTAYARMIARVRRAEDRGPAVAAGLAELHAWLTEAGRETAIELALLNQTLPTAEPEADHRQPLLPWLHRLKQAWIDKPWKRLATLASSDPCGLRQQEGDDCSSACQVTRKIFNATWSGWRSPVQTNTDSLSQRSAGAPVSKTGLARK